MNALHAEYLRLSGGVEPTASQARMIDGHDDPEGYARILERRMNDLRNDAVRYIAETAPDIGITEGDITNAEALRGITYFRHGGKAGADKSQMESIGEIALMRIVKRKHDFIGNLYRTELGREPDDAGAAFWRETWAEQFRAGIK